MNALYIDLKSSSLTQNYQKTSFEQFEEVERVESTKYVEGTRIRELHGVKKTFKIDHMVVTEKKKHWVKKSRKVMKPHICIHEELVEKSIQVDSADVETATQERQRISYEWLPVPEREKLYDRLVQSVQKYRMFKL